MIVIEKNPWLVAYERDGFGMLEHRLTWRVPRLCEMTDRWLEAVSRELGVSPERLLMLTPAWGWRSTIVQRLVDEVRTLLSDAVRMTARANFELLDATLFIKSPEAPAATHAHQDIAYRWYRPPEERYALTTWVALDDCDGDTGALSLLPGSHRELVAVRQDFLEPAFRDRAHTAEWAERAQLVPVSAGDVLVFDARTWHAAGPFRGDGLRRALALRWAAPGFTRGIDVPRPSDEPERFGVDTSGAHLLCALRRVFPDMEDDRESGAVLRTLRWLSARRRERASALPDHVWDALAELELCLSIEETHHGRPSAHAWLRVRDEVIPGLQGHAGNIRTSLTTASCWRVLTPSTDGTHHIDAHGIPAYEARFDEVLKFHAPGLAPVRRGALAWHVRRDGSPAYERRFRRTFGFYEGLAAVAGDAGWWHIRSSGEDTYAERHAWCGNFQGGRCTVRGHDGRYHHLTAEGVQAYPERWRYAGDYRDGIAVVQSEDGLSTHIDRAGHPVHGRWFLDLDVFHKGFARARDEAGWTHVDRCGVPVHDRRFAGVEPFYNGQARVERFDGGLEVIDETGRTLVELRPTRRSEFHALSGDLVGYWRTETLAAGVAVGLFDALPATTDEVTSACALTRDGAERLLHALGELGVVERVGDVWRTTVRGAFLSTHHPLSLATAALEYRGPLSQCWGRLELALRGVDLPDTTRLFEEIALEPARRRQHHRMLQSYAAHDYRSLVPSLPVRAGDVVFDAGGGAGVLAAMIARACPEAEVVVGDLPAVAAELDVPGLRAVGFDLLEPWPLSADVVVLARILHDWDDANALRILTHALAALRPGGRLALMEFLRPDEGFAGAVCDLHLLSVTGGRERRHREWVALLGEAGFTVERVVRGESVPSMLVARRSRDEEGDKR